jgi:hypothetical protein
MGKFWTVKNRKPGSGRPANTAEVLWSKVDKRDPAECWPWRGSLTEAGYGRTWIKGHGYYAHRVIYDLVHPGEITLDAPKDKISYGFVRHTCDNPVCCNPAHLIIGTQADNVQDKVDRGRQNKWGGAIGSPRAKLTEDQVREIRSLKKSGMTIDALRMRYKVSRSTISGCLYGRHYQDIE